MRFLRTFLFLSTAFLFTAAVYAAAGSSPDTIKMKKNVTLQHKKHSSDYKVEGKAIQCKDCHHKGDPQKCGPCHDGTDKGGKITMKDASHKQCQGCHKKVRDEAKAPAKCTGCHVK
jgi:hypothetical protein